MLKTTITFQRENPCEILEGSGFEYPNKSNAPAAYLNSSALLRVEKYGQAISVTEPSDASGGYI